MYNVKIVKTKKNGAKVQLALGKYWFRFSRKEAENIANQLVSNSRKLATSK